MPLFYFSGWLKDKDHELVRRVSERLESITGLSSSTAEDIQVSEM